MRRTRWVKVRGDTVELGIPVPERDDVDMAGAESQAVSLVFRDDRPGVKGECLHRLAKTFDLAIPVFVGQFDASLDGCCDRVAVTDDEIALTVVVKVADVPRLAAKREVDHVLKAGPIVGNAPGGDRMLESRVHAIDLLRIQDPGLLGVAEDRDEEEQVGLLDPVAPSFYLVNYHSPILTDGSRVSYSSGDCKYGDRSSEGRLLP